MEEQSPSLTVAQKELLRKGVELFNREQFFECHEALEEAWLTARGEQKTFLQGLIQVAVALHHARRANLTGAARLLAEGTKKLRGFAPRYANIDLGRLLADIESLRNQIAARELRDHWRPAKIRSLDTTPTG